MSATAGFTDPSPISFDSDGSLLTLTRSMIITNADSVNCPISTCSLKTYDVGCTS